MYKTLKLLVLSFFIAYAGMAQVLPKDSSSLNYRLIGFHEQAPGKKGSYLLELAIGNFATEDAFKKSITLSLTGKKDSIIAIVPAWSTEYTWRMSTVSGKTKLNGRLHHFSTSHPPDAGTRKTRVRVIKDAVKYKDALIFSDGNRALYDMKGNMLWYLPAFDGIPNDSLLDVRDLKLSPQGTITFIINSFAYEIDYNGTILWKAPDDGKVSGNKNEHYHHQLTRLANGHYMVLGTEYTLWNPSSRPADSISLDNKTMPDSASKEHSHKMDFGTIIEYDEKGKVIWSWKSSAYFAENDFRNGAKAVGKYKDIHENAFYFDDRTQTILISFRNLNRVICIRYPDGKLVATYGEVYQQGAKGNNGFFCSQHCCKRSENGDIYLFNNNCCNKDSLPKVIVLRDGPGGSVKKVWEYTCLLNALPVTSLPQFKSGGNVIELPDNSIFTSLTADNSYSNMFIVSRDKNILWSAVPEKWNSSEKKWTPLFLYRASIITNPKEQEQLIWNVATK